MNQHSGPLRNTFVATPSSIRQASTGAIHDDRSVRSASNSRLLQSPEQQTNDAGFYTCVPDDILGQIRQSSWIIVRIEATALTSHSKPIRLTKYSSVAGQPWLTYRAKNPGAKGRTAPRLRVLTVVSDRLEAIAFDFDTLHQDERSGVCDAVLSVPVIIGHELGFDLQWLLRESSLRPSRLIDLQILAAGLDPGIFLKLYKTDEAGKCGDASEEAIKRSRTQRDWRGSALLHLLAKAANSGAVDPSFSNAESWCTTHLSPGHRAFCINAVTVVCHSLMALLSSADLDDALIKVEQRAPWYPALQSALLRVSEASLRGVPFDLRQSECLVRSLGVQRDASVSDLTRFPTFQNLADELSQPVLASHLVKDAIDEYGKTQGMQLEKTKEGALRTGQDDLVMAGMPQAPWWDAWTRRSSSINNEAAVSRYQRFVCDEGRLHPLISMSTATGRFSACEPSVQNMPRNEGFRCLVKAKPGHVILSLDFSAIELRIAAVLAIRAAKEVSRLASGRYRGDEEVRYSRLIAALQSCEAPTTPLSFPDEPSRSEGEAYVEWIRESLHIAAHRVLTRGELVLKDVFERGLDPHLVTALDLAKRAGKIDFPCSALQFLDSRSLAEQVELKAIYAGERQAAKACNFGLLYGMGEKGLHRLGVTQHGLTWTLTEAREARKAWLDLYPDVRLWQLWTQHLRVFRKERGAYMVWDDHKGELVDPRWGTANIYSVSTLTNRRFHILNDYRAALNYQNQGTGADILAQSIASLPPGVAEMLILSVHDELVFEVPSRMAEEVQALARTSMLSAAETVLKGHIPMVVESSYSPTWK